MLHSTTVLVYYIFDNYWARRVSVKNYKNIFGGFIPPYLPIIRPRLTMWQIYQMLRHRAPGALTFL